MGNSVRIEPAPDDEVRAGFERVRPVADAILYEGYLLYPYRKSSAKNRVRWQFGVLAPRSWVEAHGPPVPGVAGSVESWRQQTECLLEASGDAVVQARVRFLQLQVKTVERKEAGGRYVPVESLDVAGETQLSFDEAVPHESDVVVALADLLDGDRTFEVGAPGGEEVEQLAGGVGRVVRRRWPVPATMRLRAQRLDGPRAPYRLRATTENTGTEDTLTGDTRTGDTRTGDTRTGDTRTGDTRTGDSALDIPRDVALRRSLIATHTFLGGSGLSFLSLIEPPKWAAPYARACRNIHTFPVLAGDSAACDLMLSSPIILYDHPQIAPESPGDLHDAVEIDEILSLRTLTLTDGEKREARATDGRAAAILDRVDAMPPEMLARLHGAVRSLRPVTRPGDASTSEEGEVGWTPSSC